MVQASSRRREGGMVVYSGMVCAKMFYGRMTLFYGGWHPPAPPFDVSTDYRLMEPALIFSSHNIDSNYRPNTSSIAVLEYTLSLHRHLTVRMKVLLLAKKDVLVPKKVGYRYS